MPTTADDFDTLYRGDPDPWSYRTRWYEARKRQLTLACLPAARYRSAYEPGCAIGELSVALAGRCDRLLASDGSGVAVDAARQRLASHSHVQVQRLWMPDEWPAQLYDLVVLSEFVYYLSAAQVAMLVQRLLEGLDSNGTVLACHWRRPFAGTYFDGDGVQDELHRRLELPRLLQVVDDDLRLDVWARDPRSVAEREGLV
jgi:hypothetical protein